LTSNAGIKRKLGCISFGYLFFGQAKKSNSLKKRKATSQTTTTAWAKCRQEKKEIIQSKNKLLLEPYHAWILANARISVRPSGTR
ncbi:hypothetical protein, partial [Methylophilus sp.]|uniref:hypothetical protein n=1 Tax=Methylophilus sp. TaxID=29541 RepID=UPI0025E08740